MYGHAELAPLNITLHHPRERLMSNHYDTQEFDCITGKCTVVRRSQVPDLQAHLSLPDHYFYERSYDIVDGVVSDEV